MIINNLLYIIFIALLIIIYILNIINERGDYMTNKKKTFIPKGFFNASQKIITTKEALKDVIPIKWDNIKKKG